MKMWTAPTLSLLFLALIHYAAGFAAEWRIPPPIINPPPPIMIVGAGVLGRLAADEWRTAAAVSSGPAAEVACVVIGVVRKADEARDAELRAEGIAPRIRADVDASKDKYPYVLFCASPGGNDDYAGSVKSALKLWDKDAPEGAFVFTSSAGVYAEDAGGVVTEESPVDEESPRAARLLEAEEAVIAAGGTVVRLAGLYLAERGAHNYWLTTENEIKQRPDGLINQIHYRDAARCAVAALLRGAPGDVLLAADDKPLTRAQICEEARRAPKFADRPQPTFSGDAETSGVGKVLDSSYTRESISWEPRFKTFADFVDMEMMTARR